MPEPPVPHRSYQAVLQANVVVGLLCNSDGFLQGQFGLLAVGKEGEGVSAPAAQKQSVTTEGNTDLKDAYRTQKLTLI